MEEQDGLAYLGGRMALRISSVCLLTSDKGLLRLGGGGTGPVMADCWG